MISERAQEIYVRAIELPANERDDFVADACGNDETVRADVLSLLAVTGDADAYFDALSGRIGLAALEDNDEAVPREQIGPWRLIRLLGRGGMGAVYLAERADEHYEHQVALKLLPLGAATRHAQARFLSERQILARLVHDNIARLLDGGVTDDGSPWFAMDYVEGVPIDDYCTRHALDIDARLALILDVADAVQYAHGLLIVHRDLKPGNVLVEKSGRVRLLDFGIAKVLEAQNENSAVTQLAQRPVTPAYASPEMLRGEPVDVTTDVYSLGVLMYQLLCGQLPLNFEGMTLTSMHEHAAHSEPLPVARINPSLSAELEAIVSRALSKTPPDRYRSVESFATDIRRYLANLPVMAKAPSTLYRARKFAARHWFGLAFAGFAVASLATVSGLALHAAVTAKRQAVEIALERDKAEQTKAFLLSIFEVSGPDKSKGQDITALELLETGTRRIRDELMDQPAVRAELTAAIAQVYLELSALDEADALFEEAGDLFRTQPVAQSALARTLERRAFIAEKRAEFDLALNLATDAVTLYRSTDERDALASALVTVARIAQRRGDLAQAEGQFREALSIHRAIHGPQHPAVARDLTHLGSVLTQLDQHAQAESVIREAIDIRRTVNGEMHTSLIDSLHNLAQSLQLQGRLEEARATFEQALHISNTLIPDGDSGAFYLWNGLADTQRKLGDLVAAEQNYREALALLRRFFDADHPETAMVLAKLGRVALQRGDAAAAEPLLDEGVGMIASSNPAHPFLPDMRIVLGQSLMALARYDEAAALIEQSFAALNEKVGMEHPRTQFAVRNLVSLYEAAGNPERADYFRAQQISEP